VLAAAVALAPLAVATPAPAGGMVVQFPLVTSGLIFFVTSGFTDQPVLLFGRPTAFPVIIQPILIVRQHAFIAPTAVVVLSPAVPVGAPMVPVAPMTAPGVYAAPDAAAAARESVDNIARAPELYNAHLLGAAGTVSGLEPFVDEWGHPYLMFRLTDTWRSILVLVGGQAPNLRNGLRVQVTGVFYSEVPLPGGRRAGVLQALAVTESP
jgi:hypothetical protein